MLFQAVRNLQPRVPFKLRFFTNRVMLTNDVAKTKVFTSFKKLNENAYDNSRLGYINSKNLIKTLWYHKHIHVYVIMFALILSIMCYIIIFTTSYI
jgi:hypothetical protein